MTIARTFIRGSALALGLTLAATGALAGANHNSAGSAPAGAVCQTCQPDNDVRPDHRRAEPGPRPAMVPAAAQPHRMAPAPAVIQPHPQIPAIVILLGSL